MALTVATTANASIGINVANSANGNVHFGGDITNNNACVIVVQRAGTLAANPDATQLSSRLAGGQAGVADVYSISNYEVSVSAPRFFASGPSGMNDNVSFSTLFSGQSVFRGINFQQQPGEQSIRLNNRFSITRLTVDLVADRTDAFPSGDYTASATVRCE